MLDNKGLEIVLPVEGIEIESSVPLLVSTCIVGLEEIEPDAILECRTRPYS
jgi:hypothetical protein